MFIMPLNRSLGWSLPTDGPKTLNGLLIEWLENIPAAGTQLRIGSLSIEVLQVADNTVRTVRVRVSRATGATDAAGSAEPVERRGERRSEP